MKIVCLEESQQQRRLLISEFFVASFCHFAKQNLKKEYSDTNSLSLRKKSPIITTTPYTQHERILKIFLLSYFEYRQTWLNVFM